VHPLVSAHVAAKLSGRLEARPTDEERASAGQTIKPGIVQMNAAMDRFSDEAQKLAGFHVAR
jgi:hypothetical protein